MATVKNLIITDDLDGTPNAESLVFGIDGKMFTIDLAPSNMEAVRPILEKMAAAARPFDGKSKGRKSATPKAPGKSKASTSDAAKVRAWAAENGHEVGARGRIPSEVVEAYNAAQA